MQKVSGLLLLLVSLFVAPQVAMSADLAMGGDPEMGCFATLHGVIEPGDAEEVASLFEDRHYEGPICLDSPGGRWSEGLAMMELFYERFIPTAVSAGARCESACAVAFLGGSDSTMTRTPFRSRLLHVDGRLGFHAPYLEVPTGQYNEETVLGAFDAAMEAVVQLTAWSERLALTDAFLIEMFGTGRDEMHLIDTVGEAAGLTVRLVGQHMPTELSHSMIQETCEATSPVFASADDRFDSGIGITQIYRVEADRNGMARGVAVLEYSIESWTGWYLCLVGYDATRGSESGYDADSTSRFEGTRGALFARVSESPFQEWDDPMRFAPQPTGEMVLSAVNSMGGFFYDNETFPAEIALPASALIDAMSMPNWWVDQPAPFLRAGSNAVGAAPVSSQTVSVTPLPSGHCYIIAASRRSLEEAQAFARQANFGNRAAQIYLSSNGWYAITAGTVSSATAAGTVGRMVSYGQLPPDAYCALGDQFVAELR